MEVFKYYLFIVEYSSRKMAQFQSGVK